MSPLYPTLSTPLLKVPLLLGSAALTYHGLSPPRSPSTTVRERKREEAVRDFMSHGGLHRIVRACSATTKSVLAALAFAEVSVILTQQFPSSYSTRVLAFLLPGTTGGRPMRLTAASAAGLVLAMVGGLVRLWCHRTLGHLFTWEMAVRDDHELVTSGPYAIVRHPNYTGLVLLTCGHAILLSSKESYFTEAGLWKTVAGKAVGYSIPGYLAWLTLSLSAKARKEDAMLRKEFGARWDEWAKRTPWRVIPFIY